MTLILPFFFSEENTRGQFLNSQLNVEKNVHIIYIYLHEVYRFFDTLNRHTYICRFIDRNRVWGHGLFKYK